MRLSVSPVLLPLLLPFALHLNPVGSASATTSAFASPWVTDPISVGAHGAPALLPEDARTHPEKISALKSSIIEAQQFYDDAGQAVRVACEKEFLALPMLSVDLDPDAGMWDLVARSRQVQAEALVAIKRLTAIDRALPIAEWYKQVFTAAAAAESGDSGLMQSIREADNASLEFCSIAFGALGVIGDWARGCEAAPACSCGATTAESFCADQEREEACAEVFELFTSVWEKKCRRAALSKEAATNLKRASALLRGMENAQSSAGQGVKNMSADLLPLLKDDDRTDLHAAVGHIHKMDSTRWKLPYDTVSALLWWWLC